MSANPYEPLQSANTGSSAEYSFEGVVEKRDVGTLFSGNRLLAGFLGFLAAFMISEAINAFRTRSMGQGITILCVALFVALLSVRMWLSASRFIKQNRFLVGSVRGSISSNRIQIESHGMRTTTMSNHVQIDAVTQHGIGLMATVYRFLPKHLFDDYDGVMQLAKELQQHSNPLIPGDEPFRAEFPEAAQHVGPTHAITVCGEIRRSDFQTPEIEDRLRKIHWSMIYACVWVGIAGLVTYLVSQSPIAGLGVAGVLGFWTYRKFIRFSLASLRTFREEASGEDKILFFLRGWLDSSSLSLWSASGSSRYEWGAFESFSRKDENAIIARLSPKAVFVSIHRRLFSTDEDWNTAIEYITAAVPETHI